MTKLKSPQDSDSFLNSRGKKERKICQKKKSVFHFLLLTIKQGSNNCVAVNENESYLID